MVPKYSVSLLLCFVMGAYGQYFYSAPNFFNPIQYQQPIYTFPQTIVPQYRQHYNGFPSTYSEPSRQNNHVESNFRGYAYHMENKDGARSNVIFLTGPELHKMKQNVVFSSRTSASDAVDSNAINVKSQEEEIQGNPFESLIEYLKHPQMGVQNFYYVNDELVMRGVDDGAPVPKARSLETVVDSPLVPLLKSTFNLGVTTEKTDNNTAASEQNVKTIEPDTTSTTTTTEQPEKVTEQSTTSGHVSEETTKMEIVVEEEETTTLESTTIEA